MMRKKHMTTAVLSALVLGLAGCSNGGQAAGTQAAAVTETEEETPEQTETGAESENAENAENEDENIDVAVSEDEVILAGMDDAEGSYPAIVVAHPNGGVKEQVAGLFAQRLAENGYITIVMMQHIREPAAERPVRQICPPAAWRISGQVLII